MARRLADRRRYPEDELEELDELDEPPPPPPPPPSLLEELELEEVELEEVSDDELELDVLELELVDDSEEDEDVASVGPLPPQAERTPTPARAAPPESRTRNSRLSVSAASSSFLWSSDIRRLPATVEEPILSGRATARCNRPYHDTPSCLRKWCKWCVTVRSASESLRRGEAGF